MIKVFFARLPDNFHFQLNKDPTPTVCTSNDISYHFIRARQSKVSDGRIGVFFLYFCIFSRFFRPFDPEPHFPRSLSSSGVTLAQRRDQGRLHEIVYPAFIFANFVQSVLFIFNFFLSLAPSCSNMNIRFRGNVLLDWMTNIFVGIITSIFNNTITNIVSNSLNEFIQATLDEMNARVQAQGRALTEQEVLGLVHQLKNMF